MTAIDTAMLAAMRSAIAELLPDSCIVQSVSRLPDGFGGVTETWNASGTVSCRLDMQQGREQVTGGAVQPYTSYTLSVPYDATVTAANRIVHGGNTYAVTSVNNDQSWIAVKRLALEAL